MRFQSPWQRASDFFFVSELGNIGGASCAIVNVPRKTFEVYKNQRSLIDIKNVSYTIFQPPG